MFRTCHLAIPGALKRKEKGVGRQGARGIQQMFFREIPPTPSVRIHVKGSPHHAQIKQEGDRSACLQPRRGDAKGLALAVVPFRGRGPVAGYSADNETRVR